MSTQYDDIGAAYNEMRKHAAAQISDYNLQVITTPLIRGARVLDLACGTGLLSNTMLSWGASQVVGIDISSAMIDVAKTSTTSQDIQYEVQDCSVPTVFAGGEFDIVLGSWLLNYAATRDELVNMYRTIDMNLKDGGTFIGVTPHPTEDPRAHTEKMCAERPVQRGEITLFPRDDVRDGIGTHLIFVHDSANVEFDAYHLKKSVYETAAREAGLRGRLAWEAVRLPPKATEDPEYLQSYLTVPHFGILVIWKN